jgi:hypothetical protein
MYRVLGADGIEYGPVDGEVLSQWITQGRANAQTKVKPEGGADWQTLASVPEFQADLAASPGAPPPLPAAQAALKTSGMAIASLVLGVLGICGITALVGLILGIISLVKINRSGLRRRFSAATPPVAARHTAVGTLSNLRRLFLKNSCMKGILCIES